MHRFTKAWAGRERSDHAPARKKRKHPFRKRNFPKLSTFFQNFSSTSILFPGLEFSKTKSILFPDFPCPLRTLYITMSGTMGWASSIPTVHVSYNEWYNGMGKQHTVHVDNIDHFTQFMLPGNITSNKPHLKQ